MRRVKSTLANHSNEQKYADNIYIRVPGTYVHLREPDIQDNAILGLASLTVCAFFCFL